MVIIKDDVSQDRVRVTIAPNIGRRPRVHDKQVNKEVYTRFNIRETSLKRHFCKTTVKIKITELFVDRHAQKGYAFRRNIGLLEMIEIKNFFVDSNAQKGYTFWWTIGLLDPKLAIDS